MGTAVTLRSFRLIYWQTTRSIKHNLLELLSQFLERLLCQLTYSPQPEEKRPVVVVDGNGGIIV